MTFKFRKNDSLISKELLKKTSLAEIFIKDKKYKSILEITSEIKNYSPN